MYPRIYPLNHIQTYTHTTCFVALSPCRCPVPTPPYTQTHCPTPSLTLLLVPCTVPAMQAASMLACSTCTSFTHMLHRSHKGLRPAALTCCCICRRIRCGWAQHKQSVNNLDYATVDRADPHNCNVYVGNVSQEVSDADLRHHFGQFGSITDVKIYRKGPSLHLACAGCKSLTCISTPS